MELVQAGRISSHPDIDMVSFTGSTQAGISVAKLVRDSKKGYQN